MVQGGAYGPAFKRGWKGNAAGTSWTFVNGNGGVNGGVRRIQLVDRSRGAAGGRVRFTVKVSFGYFPIASGNEPVELTLIAGNDAAGAAGECGKSAFVAGDCSFNEPGTRLKCKK